MSPATAAAVDAHVGPISGGMGNGVLMIVRMMRLLVMMKRRKTVKLSVLLAIGSTIEAISASAGVRKDRGGLRRRSEWLELLKPV